MDLGPLPDTELGLRRLVETAGPDPKTVPLDALPEDASVVLLGDPGMGKTTSLGDAAAATPGGRFVTVRRFVAAGLGREGLQTGATLFLDALDEALAAGVAAPLDAVAGRLERLGRPRFWLSCRPVDWASVAGQSLLEDCAPGALVVARLLPLSDEQVIGAARARGVEPHALLSRMSGTGLDELLRNPWTLRLVLDLAAAEGNLPRSRHDLFDRACRLLARERADRPRPGVMPAACADDLLGAAGGIYAGLLISGQEAVGLDPDADDATPISAFAPIAPTHVLEAALRTRLFAAAGEHRWVWPHRTVAEFLGAAFLAGRVLRHGFPLGRAVALLCGDGSSPHPALRGLFAWLVTLLPGRGAAELVARDPYGVISYGDPSRLPLAALRALMAGLRELADRDPFFRAGGWGEAPFAALAVPDLVPELGAVLAEKPGRPHLLSCALDALAKGAPRPELAPDLTRFLTDCERPVEERAAAVPAFLRATEGDGHRAARDLFRRFLGEAELDPHARLAGTMLLRLYPDHLDADDLIGFLDRYIRSDPGEGDWLHLGHRLPDLVPGGTETDLLDHICALLPGDGSERPLSRSHEVRMAARDLSASAIRGLPMSDAARLAAWAPRLGGRWSGGKGEHNALRRALAARPDLLAPMLLQVAGQLDSGRLADAPGDALWELLQMLPWWRPLPEDAGAMLLDAALAEAADERAAPLFAASLALIGGEPPDLALFERAWEAAREREVFAPILAQRVETPWFEWRKEEAERRRKQRRAEARRHARNTRVLESKREGIGAGTDICALTWLAQCWFDWTGDGTGRAALPHAERLRAVVGDEMARLAEQGFRALATHGPVPSPADLAQQAATGWLSSNGAFLAGADLVFTDAGDGLPLFTADRLVTLVCFALATTTFTEIGNTMHVDRRPWVGRVVAALPVESTRGVLAFLAPQLAARANHVTGLHELCNDERFAAIRPGLLPDLLDLVATAGDCDTLLDAALRELPHSTVLDIARRKLSEAQDLTPEERWRWLHAAWRLDPESYADEVRGRAERDPELLKDLARATGDTTWGRDLSRAVPLTVAHRVLILRLAGPRYPPAPMPRGGWSPPTAYDWGRFVHAQLDRLAAAADPAAEAVLADLVDDPDFALHRDHVLHALVMVRRERQRQVWEAPAAADAVYALAGGPPASAADLVAFVEAHLRDLREALRTTQDNLWRGFWNLDGYGRPTEARPENACRDEVAKLLRPAFERAGVALDTEVRFGVDKRCDIVARASGDRITPVEVKCGWHPELWTAWETQLLGLYATEPRAADTGIYLVVWFGAKRGKSRRVASPPPGSAAPESAADVEAILTGLIRARGAPIRVVVLDASAPA